MGLVELSSAQDGTHAHLFLFQEALSFNKIIEWNTIAVAGVCEIVFLCSWRGPEATSQNDLIFPE